MMLLLTVGGLDYQTTTTGVGDDAVTTQNTTSSLGSLTASRQTTTTCTAGCDGDNPTNAVSYTHLRAHET